MSPGNKTTTDLLHKSVDHSLFNPLPQLRGSIATLLTQLQSFVQTFWSALKKRKLLYSVHTVYHSISQYITVYHSIPQYITVYHSISQYITVYHGISTTVYHSIPQYTTVYHSISQYITVYHSIYHSILQHITYTTIHQCHFQVPSVFILQFLSFS